MPTTNGPRQADVSSGPSGGRLVPGVSVALGLVMGVPLLLRGQTWPGVALLSIMVGYAAVLVLLSRRFETVGLLRGSSVDERHDSVHTRAAVFSGYSLALVITAGFVHGVATGHPATMTFALLGFVGGTTFIGAMAYHTVRG